MGAQPTAEQLGRAFVDAFNRRDAEGLVALCHADVEFLPTVLVGARAVYHGHDGMRRWIAELRAARVALQVRLRKVRALGPDRLALLTETCLEDEVISPSAMIAELRDGLILRARAYLSDELTLTRVGVLPPEGDA